MPPKGVDVLELVDSAKTDEANNNRKNIPKVRLIKVFCSLATILSMLRRDYINVFNE